VFTAFSHTLSTKTATLTALTLKVYRRVMAVLKFAAASALFFSLWHEIA